MTALRRDDGPAAPLAYIARLRRKLEPEPSSPKFILLERGLGYRLKPGD